MQSRTQRALRYDRRLFEKPLQGEPCQGPPTGSSGIPRARCTRTPGQGAPGENSAAFRRYRAGLLAVRSGARGD